MTRSTLGVTLNDDIFDNVWTQVHNVDDNYEALLVAAETLQIECLKTACEYQLISSATVENISRLASIGEQYSCSALESFTKQFIKTHKDEIREIEGWKRQHDDDEHRCKSPWLPNLDLLSHKDEVFIFIIKLFYSYFTALRCKGSISKLTTSTSY